MNSIKSFLTLSLLLLYGATMAQIPDDYYDGTEGLYGEQLRMALHNIIDDHIEYSYDDLRDFILPESDEDPTNPNNVILIYSGISRDKDDFGGNVGQWNREHTWAKSHGDFGNSPAEGTDAHHIRPADVQINSTRGNLDFDNGGSPVSNCPGCKVDSDSFEPGDDTKGDVARMIFYMATRYMGGDDELFLTVVDEVNTSPEPKHGKLSTLMAWHEADPPDAFEQTRNEVIYSYQENRNPFIDHPEFVEAIWGDPTMVNVANESTFQFFPNPATDKLTIVCAENAGYSYTLYSHHGALMQEGEFSQRNSFLDISYLSDGLYILLVELPQRNSIEKFKLLKTSR